MYFKNIEKLFDKLEDNELKKKISNEFNSLLAGVFKRFEHEKEDFFMLGNDNYKNSDVYGGCLLLVKKKEIREKIVDIYNFNLNENKEVEQIENEENEAKDKENKVRKLIQ